MGSLLRDWGKVRLEQHRDKGNGEVKDEFCKSDHGGRIMI